VGRFFLLGGLTLLLDDLPDVSRRVESGLNWLKAKAHKAKKMIVATQVVTGAFSLYVSAAVSIAMLQVPEWVTIANFLLVGTTSITGVTSFIFVKRKVWHGIGPRHF
jgi:protein-S-isoprenylcysteine O-methyltransferase Ste14